MWTRNGTWACVSFSKRRSSVCPFVALDCARSDTQVVKSESNGRTYYVDEVDEEKRPFKALLDVGIRSTSTGYVVFLFLTFPMMSFRAGWISGMYGANCRTGLKGELGWLISHGLLLCLLLNKMVVEVLTCSERRSKGGRSGRIAPTRSGESESHDGCRSVRLRTKLELVVCFVFP